MTDLKQDMPASTGARPEDLHWRALFLTAGSAALLTALLIPLQIVAFVVWPPPASGDVIEWFTLFNENWLRGLISFDVIILIEEVLLIPIVLAVYIAMRRGSASVMLIAAATWLMSATLFIASNTAFEMLALSHGYAGATSDAQRATFEAAGRAMLASYMSQGSAFVAGYVLASIAGILVGAAMLRDPWFGKAGAYAAISANALGLGLFVPVIGVPVSILSVVILIVWYALTGWRLLHFSSLNERLV